MSHCTRGMLSASIEAFRDGSSLKMKRCPECPEHAVLLLLILVDRGSYSYWPNVGTLKLGLARTYSDDQPRIGFNLEGDTLR